MAFLKPLRTGIAGSAIVCALPACQENALPVVPISAPDATLDAEFAHVISVRELSDGRVLIAENQENRLAVGDFARNVATTIGRSGKGPGEYTSVGRLWAIGGDTTFMSEPYLNRWHIAVQDKIVETLSDVPALRVFPNNIVGGVNARRDVFGWTVARDAKGKWMQTDSMLAVRVAWAGTAYDTVARSAPVKMDGAGAAAAASSPPPKGKRMFQISVSARDQLVVFQDGHYAIVRGDPYRVEWCTAQKQCAYGSPLSGKRPTMTDADRDAYRMTLVRTARTTATEADGMVGWPEKLPPFHTPGGPDEASVWPAADGKIVIERVPTAATPSYSYDVVNRDGKRTATVSIPPGQFIIGLGAKSAYVVKTDENGVQHLQRHPWSY